MTSDQIVGSSSFFPRLCSRHLWWHLQAKVKMCWTWSRSPCRKLLYLHLSRESWTQVSSDTHMALEDVDVLYMCVSLVGMASSSLSISSFETIYQYQGIWSNILWFLILLPNYCISEALLRRFLSNEIFVISLSQYRLMNMAFFIWRPYCSALLFCISLYI